MALLLVAVLHFVPEEDDPLGAVLRLGNRIPSGSYLVVSHSRSHGQLNLAASHRQRYQRTPTQRQCAPESIARFFSGSQLIAPGLVSLQL